MRIFRVVHATDTPTGTVAHVSRTQIGNDNGNVHFGRRLLAAPPPRDLFRELEDDDCCGGGGGGGGAGEDGDAAAAFPRRSLRRRTGVVSDSFREQFLGEGTDGGD